MQILIRAVAYCNFRVVAGGGYVLFQDRVDKEVQVELLEFFVHVFVSRC